MKIEVWHIGKTKSTWIAKGENDYLKKCKRFAQIKVEYLSGAKGLAGEKIRENDSKQILDKLDKVKKQFTILLDERGTKMSSPQLARLIEQTAATRGPSIRFITGGSHGVNDEVRKRCDIVLAVSDLVFTHEMVRVILIEQIYRAFTILRGESYHHE